MPNWLNQEVIYTYSVPLFVLVKGRWANAVSGIHDECSYRPASHWVASSSEAALSWESVSDMVFLFMPW